jgi:hypothetical protein
MQPAKNISLVGISNPHILQLKGFVCLLSLLFPVNAKSSKQLAKLPISERLAQATGASASQQIGTNSSLLNGTI